MQYFSRTALVAINYLHNILCCIDEVHTDIRPVTSVHQISKSNVGRAHTTTTSYDVLLVWIQCLDGVSTVTAEIL